MSTQVPTKNADPELERYRSLIEPPKEFKDGFGWVTVIGIIFCGVVMMPGGIYLGLMTGAGLGAAAQWVTVILFMEIARRAMQPLSKQNLVVLLHCSWVMMAAHWLFPGGPMGEIVYRAFLSTSEAARDAGMIGSFPKWWVPSPDSAAIKERILWHKDWLIPISVAFAVAVLGLIQKYTLGYFFFRLTSDVEQLPFPLAPINAQGATALAEADDQKTPEDETAAKQQSRTRWRIFSMGAYIGIAFGIFQVGIPAVTGLFLAQPFYLIPQPFVDTTTMTESFLPATPTGMTIDLGLLLIGFVLPFYAVVGTVCAVLLTLIANPILHHFEFLQTWQPGMNTVNTTFSNSVDFWLSFGIGASVGIAIVSVVATVRDVRRKFREHAKTHGGRGGTWDYPRPGRGDYPLWIALCLYLMAATGMVSLGIYLLPKSWNITFFLFFFAYIYVPFISYINARLLGMAGQTVEIPYIKEASFILANAKGVEIWLAPMPLDNFGYQAQAFRVNELTGVSFWSLVKTELVAVPILFILSIVFWGFIWKSSAIPSEFFPAAQINWELQSKNQVLLYSSTFVPPGEDPANVSITNSSFWRAIKPPIIASSAVGVIVLNVILTFVGAPSLIIYGLVRGFGGFPHQFILEFIGALIGRFYLQKKYGTMNFLKTAPALMAGYFTGVGLIAMATIALKLIKAAVSAAPF